MPILESAADQKYQHSLPTVSFRIVEDDKALLAPAGVHSEQSRSYGYNDFSDFERPEFYIRYIEPIEAELKGQVEYDMDEQDQAWLDNINAERKKDQSGPISYEVFEIMVDKLEKEWFDLIKRVPQPASHLPVEDSRCSICDDPEGENSNAIVFCDGCNLAVHQDCYGVPYIPEGQWLCRKCTVAPENPVSCLFCPNEGGAFKQTTTGHWAHLLCSIWIPEVTVSNAIYMEPVDGVEMVPKSRWKLICSLCRERVGACIQCDNKSCFTAFHVTCARQMGLLMSMKAMSTDGQLRAFCEKHLPAGSQDDFDEDEDEDGSNYSGTPVAQPPPKPRVQHRLPKRKIGPVTTKSARAHTKSYRPGPPIVPQVIVQTLLDYIAKFLIRKKQPFVERLCRYWSLKREARRGAPLLKRLHLEPWTAASASKQQTDAEKATKLKFLTMLRNDLEKVRLLAELVRKREKEKLRQTQLINDMVDQFIFPYYGRLRLTLEKISAMDRQEIFLHPINAMEVPDYYDVVKEPMCWLYIDDKIERNRYRNVEEFKHDVNLVLDNAILYNAPETTFSRIAKRIKANAKPLLEDLDSILEWSSLRPSLADGDEPMTADDVEPSGDLEPSLVLLSSLLAKPAGGTEGSVDHLAELFRFALDKPRAPTPPPEPPKKRNYMSAEDKKRRWEEREQQAKQRVAARSSRATAAAARAFEEEAGLDTQHTPKASGQRTRGRDKHVEEQEVAAHASHSNQVGVVGYETVAVLSDRERRAQERTLDLVTEDVDNQDLFKRFNVGWVLPEGSKRRRPDKPERPPDPPKTQVTQAKSEPSPEPDEPLEHRPLPSSRPSSLTPVSSSSSSATEPLPEPARPRRGAPAVQAEDIYRSGRKRKQPDSPEPVNNTKKRKAKEVEEDPKPETRASVTSHKPPSRPRPRRSTAAPRSVSAKPAGDEEEDPYPPSTLVWAKLTSFPFFPAEIIDQDDDDPSEIPPSVFKNRAQAEKDNGATGQRTWLVRFFDAQASYGWIPASRLDLLGEDNNLDEMYLAGKEKSRVKGFKSAHVKTACRKAYREALAQMEVEEDE